MNIFEDVIYSCDAQLYFQHQSSVSHDPSEIIIIYWFAAQETFLIINAENSCCLIFLWKLGCFFRHSLMNRWSSKSCIDLKTFEMFIFSRIKTQYETPFSLSPIFWTVVCNSSPVREEQITASSSRCRLLHKPQPATPACTAPANYISDVLWSDFNPCYEQFCKYMKLHARLEPCI